MNQRVLVTAGASGIGREIARAFRANGAKVFVGDIEFGIRANAILPGAVEGPRIERVLEGRAKLSGKSIEEEKKSALSIQSLQRFVDPRDIATLALFLASDAA